MKTHITQKEILLMTGTSFEQRRLERPNERQKYTSFKKVLPGIFDQSDWNIILPLVLPEIIEDNNDDDVPVSFIRKGHSFIQLEMSTEPLIIEREYSLDPYLFLSSQIYN
jgi:hypothetical protein